MSFDRPFEKKKVAQYFSSVATTYNENNYVLAGTRGKYADVLRRHSYILEMIQGLNGKALEVGCGTGEMLCALLERNFEVVGLDMAAGMIEASRSRVKGRFAGKSVDLVVGDVENLGFGHAEFDLVIAAGVIEYLESEEKAIRDFERILKPGGVVILSVRNKLNLSRMLVTARDLLASLPLVGSAIQGVSGLVCRLLSLPPNTGVPGRRHIPWQLKRQMRAIGLHPTEDAFYHFAVMPRFIERRYHAQCARWEEKLEILSRTPLGYFGNQYIVKAQKVSNGNHCA
jgi:ubiquinone/menaquinone biosynthesis C-methylase UbiE